LVVYLDLVFLANLLIDAALLRMTAWTRRLSFNWWRVLLASMIGAMYVVMIFAPALSFLFTTLMKFLFSAAMLLVAFGFVHLQHFLKNLGAFYLVSFCAAGCMFGVHYLWQSSDELLSGIWFSQTGGMTFHVQTGLVYVALSFVGALWFYRSVQRSRQRQEARKAFTANMEIVIDEVRLGCQGLIDTGNRLYDPLTRHPVLVTELRMWRDYMPSALYERLMQGKAEDIVQDLEAHAFRWRDRLRLVPYRGIHRGTTFMLAIKPDKLTVEYGGQKHVSSKVLIGLKSEPMHAEQAYQAIIHPELVNM
jgi:stage II sporulation protein GA (sporulation sigma-E factor processing peptidase)